MIENERDVIEAIKLLYGTIGYRNISIEKTLEVLVDQLVTLFNKTQDIEYCKVALLHIKVYLEMGFVYEQQKDAFDFILTINNIDKDSFWDQILSKKNYLGKTDLRRIIKRWSASKYHTKSINEVIEEIIEYVNNNRYGVYYYHSNQNPQKKEADDVYELIINEHESYLHDLKRNRFYKLR
jgi:hypothetical protein